MTLDASSRSEILSEAFHGSEWLEPYRRTVDLWYPRFRQARDAGMPGISVFGFIGRNTQKFIQVLFLHEWIFCDGFPLYTYRKKEFYSWTTTFAELPYEMRSSFSAPGIWVQCSHDSNQLKGIGGYDTMLKAFRTGKEFLIRGIPMYASHLGRVVMVFCVFHGIQGDSPARTELAGFKKAGGLTFRLCHECDADQDTYKQNLLNGVSYPERSNFIGDARTIDQLRQHSPDEWVNESRRYGINRYSRDNIFDHLIIVDMCSHRK